MERKFELVEGMSTMVGNKKLYRIAAIRDFGKVKAGAIGGYVDSEMALSQMGDCWIADEAMVYGGARIEGDAVVYDEAVVSGAVIISDYVRVDGDAKIQNHSDYCITIGGNIHIASGAHIENPDNYAAIMTHEGTVSLFRNSSNGLDICFYRGEDLVHQSVSEFLEEHASNGDISFISLMMLGAICSMDQCMKA